MKRKFELIYFFVVLFMVIGVNGECDRCQHSNPIACHGENVYSLCVNGIPTYNNITCPNGFVCTGDVFLCLPSEVVTPICPRKMSAMAIPPNLCGVCASHGKVFACLNKTTIAFCFGEDEPYYESLSFCREGTVCDLNSGANFCTDEKLVQPSCPRDEWSIPTTLATKPTFPETTANTFTKEPSTTELRPSTSGQTTTILQQTTTLEPTTTEATTVTFDKATTTPDVTTTPAVTTTTLQATTIIEELTATFGTTTDITETETTEELTTSPEESTSTTSPAPTTSETTTSEETTTTPTILSDETTTESTTITATTIPTTTSEDTTTTTVTFDKTTTRPDVTTTPVVTTTTLQSTTIIEELTTTFGTTTDITETETTEELTTSPEESTSTTFPAPTTSQTVTSEETTTTPTILSDETTTESTTTTATTIPTTTLEDTTATTEIKTPTTPLTTTPLTTTVTTTVPTTTTTTLATTTTTIPTTSQTTSTPTITSLTPTITTPQILTPLEICERNGIESQTSFFALPGDTTCKNYIMCTKPGASWSIIQLTCSANKWFDPVSGKCSESYSCPSANLDTTTIAGTTTTFLTKTTDSTTIAATSTTKTTTETKTTTQQPTTSTEAILTPLELCARNGITTQTTFFVLPGDTTCKNYIMCTKLGSNWTVKEMACSSNKWFDPGLGKCSESYRCLSTSSGVAKPSASTLTTTPAPTTSTTSTPTTAAPTTIKTTTETQPITPQSSTTTERILTALEACELNGVESKTTFIALPSDATCKKYIMCSKPSSSWTAKEMTCSSNKWFDPGLSKCSSDYKCPT